jgi:pimeloyl-ACP methyl ester carboxylesterase
MRPVTRYAKSGDVHIAYQVTGAGPLDLVFVPGFVSHLEADWDSPARARFIERLGSFSRLIRFDKRGTGLSDRVPIPTLEQRMDDVRAVMDAVGSERAALFGISEGGPMSLLFAATYPTRTTALVIYGSYARRLWAADHPFGRTQAEWDEIVQRLEREWGGPVAVDIWAPSRIHDERFQEGWAAYLRLAASPGAAATVMRMNGEIDVRHVLPVIRVPTLILHRVEDRVRAD